jgi:DNA (cytosine-5)-methyltransferase 1
VQKFLVITKFKTIHSLVEDDEKAREETLAICNVFIPLRDTTMGQAGARVLPNGYNYAMLPGQQEIPLSELTPTHDVAEPELRQGGIIWDSIEKGGDYLWTFAYRFSTKQTSKKIQISGPLKGMDLFAGAGGVSLGFQLKGLEFTFGVEKDPSAAETLKENFERKIIYQEDIRYLLELIKEGKVDPRTIELDFLHASPPCQGHSCSNKRRGSKEAENNSLTLETLKFVEFQVPTVFTLENVLGIVDKFRKGETGRTSLEDLQEVIGTLIALDYQVRISAVDAMDYGDPQTRKRVILIAIRNGFELPRLPKPSHGPEREIPHLSAKDAIGNLEHVQPRLTTAADHIRANHHTLFPEDDETVPSYVTDWQKEKLEGDKPSPTVRCLAALGHYSLDRYLTPKERARLQGFPDDYKFCGSQIEVLRQIGNAVPIGLAKAIAETVRGCFEFSDN